MRIIFALCALLAAPSWGLAQSHHPEQCDHFARAITAIVEGRTPAQNQDFAVDLLDLSDGARCFAMDAAARSARPFRIDGDFIHRFESSRGDKEGGGAGASGGTSVVSQGPAAKVLSVAAESGAVTQSVAGQVVTVRGNLAGLPAALVRKNLIPYCVPQDRSNAFCAGNSTLGILRRFSFAAAFNGVQTEAVGTTDTSAPASPAGQPVTFEANKNQLASASLRIELHNKREIGSSETLKAWTANVGKQMDAASSALLQAGTAFTNAVMQSPKYALWRAEHLNAVRSAGRDRGRLEEALEAALADLHPILQEVLPDVSKTAAAALGAYSNFFLAQDQFIDEIATKKVVAFEYTNSRPSSAPHTSNFKFIIDAPLSKTTKLVANTGFTLYNESQTNTDGSLTKYRDAQAAVQLEHGLGKVAIIGPASLSFAFYYQYQHAPALLKVDPLKPAPGVTFIDLPENAKTVFATKGDILLGQIKLSLTPKESSIKVPLAVTYSNRTELIDKPTWKAQLGVTYDFDSLFARGK